MSKNLWFRAGGKAAVFCLVYNEKELEIILNTFDDGVVKIRTMGGTVPIAPFINTLGIPAIILPLVNPDNNQHSPNENFRLGQINYGLQVFYSLLSTKIN